MRSPLLSILFACVALPVLAQDLMDGSRVDDIVTIAGGYGPAVLETRPDGIPLIAGSIDGVPYYVFFMNCSAPDPCQDLNFYAAFAGIKPTMGALNAWTRDTRFGNAYLDADLDAAIEFDVNLEHGVSRDNLDAAFSLWSVLLGEYTAYVGYKAP